MMSFCCCSLHYCLSSVFISYVYSIVYWSELYWHAVGDERGSTSQLPSTRQPAVRRVESSPQQSHTASRSRPSLGQVMATDHNRGSRPRFKPSSSGETQVHGVHLYVHDVLMCTWYNHVYMMYTYVYMVCAYMYMAYAYVCMVYIYVYMVYDYVYIAYTYVYMVCVNVYMVSAYVCT